MITYFTSSETKSKEKRCHIFACFFFPRAIYALDKFDVQNFCPLEVFSRVTWKTGAHLSENKILYIYVYTYISLYFSLIKLKMDMRILLKHEKNLFFNDHELPKWLICVFLLFLNIIVLLKMVMICIYFRWHFRWLIKCTAQTAYAFWVCINIKNVHSNPT